MKNNQRHSMPFVPLGDFSIMYQIYEKEMNRKYGIELEKIKNGVTNNLDPEKKNNNNFFKNGYSPNNLEVETVLEKYTHIPGYCSMYINNEGELDDHIENTYETSYIHYAWAKEINMKGRFPYFCCGNSSRNILMTLMERGYPNATYLYNDKFDHGYVGLPFVISDGREGFIIIDPTSDQLFDDVEHRPRNNIFVTFGNKWEYKTDWARGADLYTGPRESEFMNLHTLRKIGWDYSKRIETYYKKVFENPVIVHPEF